MNEQTISFSKIVIYGVGLIGGAIGLAVRKQGLSNKVVGIGRSKAKFQKAVEIGAIDEGTTDVEKGLEDADLVILALPVGEIINCLPAVAKAVKPGCIVTDTGSVKKTIVEAAKSCIPPDRFFLGSHPMAGSEKTGVENAGDVKLEKATCFVTLVQDTDRGTLAKLALFWKSLKMIPLLIDPSRHDRYVSLFSHLPHLASAALVQTCSEAPDDQNFLKQVCGSGFRDATRLAMGNANLWTDIIQTNAEYILPDIDRLIRRLEELKAILSKKDAARLKAYLEEAKQSRQSFKE